MYFNTFGFDVGLITEAAVGNSDGSRQGIRDAVEKLKGLPAVNGPVTYTAEDHTGQNFESIGASAVWKREFRSRCSDIDRLTGSAVFAIHALSGAANFRE